MKLFSKIRGLRPDGHDLVVQADLARDSRNWPLAAELYRKALERQPKNPPIWIQYGHALKESGHLGEAEDAYRRSLADAPDVADSHLQLGHVLKLQGRSAEAENAYLRAFELDPMLPHPLTELSALGWSERRLSELRRPVEARRSSSRTSADAAQSTHADATSPDTVPASFAGQRTVEDTSQRLTSDLRRQIGEILGIDLRWVARRHPAIHSLSGVATATPDARRRLLQRAGVDFSPFVSVRRMCEQFPDYDFSSGAALIDFIEQRLPASKRVSPHWLYDEKFYSSLYSGSDNSEWARYFGFLADRDI